MAYDWIKMRTDMYRDPKVCVIAETLLGYHEKSNVTPALRSVTRNAVVGALVTVWGVLRHRGERDGDDLFIKKCNISVIDDISDIANFGSAMEVVGWVQESSGGLLFPRFFGEYNVDPNDEPKAKNAERQRRFREKKKASELGENSNVTVTSRSNTEKRREELTTSSLRSEVLKQKPQSDFSTDLENPPTVATEKGGAKPKTRQRSFPFGDTCPEQLREWALIRNRDYNPDAMFEQWRNYCLSNAKTYADWDAAWRTWVINTPKYDPNRGKRVFHDINDVKSKIEASRMQLRSDLAGAVGGRFDERDVVDVEVLPPEEKSLKSPQNESSGFGLEQSPLWGDDEPF